MAHNFIYIHNKSTAFPGLIFMKLSIVHWNYLQISYTEFHPSQNKCGKCELELINNLSVKYAFRYSCFHENRSYSRCFCGIFYWILSSLEKKFHSQGMEVSRSGDFRWILWNLTSDLIIKHILPHFYFAVVIGFVM